MHTDGKASASADANTDDQPVEHVPMAAAQLAEVLEDMARRVREGDSFEGFIEYLMPGPFQDPVLDEADYAVRASYRVGNTMGQVDSQTGWSREAAEDYCVEQHWPWCVTEWKPAADPIRNLTKASALLAAEIERLQRRDGTQPAEVAPVGDGGPSGHDEDDPSCAREQWSFRPEEGGVRTVGFPTREAAQITATNEGIDFGRVNVVEHSVDFGRTWHPVSVGGRAGEGESPSAHGEREYGKHFAVAIEEIRKLPAEERSALAMSRATSGESPSGAGVRAIEELRDEVNNVGAELSRMEADVLDLVDHLNTLLGRTMDRADDDPLAINADGIRRGIDQLAGREPRAVALLRRVAASGDGWSDGLDEDLRDDIDDFTEALPPEPEAPSTECPTCGGEKVIRTDRPGATSPRPCPACDPNGTCPPPRLRPLGRPLPPDQDDPLEALAPDRVWADVWIDDDTGTEHVDLSVDKPGPGGGSDYLAVEYVRVAAPATRRERGQHWDVQLWRTAPDKVWCAHIPTDEEMAAPEGEVRRFVAVPWHAPLAGSYRVSDHENVHQAKWSAWLARSEIEVVPPAGRSGGQEEGR